MDSIIKIASKDFNGELLHQELLAGGLSENHLTWLGFASLGGSQYTPSDVHGFEPGSMAFRYEPELTPARERSLDTILDAHDATLQSRGQINKDVDMAALPDFVAASSNFSTLSRIEQNALIERLFRQVVRLTDRSTDI